ELKLLETLRQRLGLAVLDLGLVEHDDAAVLGLGRKRVPEGERADLLRQIDRVAAHHRTERTAATAKQVDARRAVAGTASTLLAVHLLAGAPDVGAVLHGMGAGAALGQLPHDAALDQIGTRLKAEDGVVQRDRSGRLAVERGDLELHHAPPLSAGGAVSAGADAAAAPTLNLPGFGPSFGSAFFTAPRTLHH